MKMPVDSRGWFCPGTLDLNNMHCRLEAAPFRQDSIGIDGSEKTTPILSPVASSALFELVTSTVLIQRL